MGFEEILYVRYCLLSLRLKIAPCFKTFVHLRLTLYRFEVDVTQGFICSSEGSNLFQPIPCFCKKLMCPCHLFSSA